MNAMEVAQEAKAVEAMTKSRPGRSRKLPAAGVNVGEETQKGLDRARLEAAIGLVQNVFGELLAATGSPPDQPESLDGPGFQAAKPAPEAVEGLGEGVHGPDLNSKYRASITLSHVSDVAHHSDMRGNQDDQDPKKRSRPVLAAILEHLIQTKQTSPSLLTKKVGEEKPVLPSSVLHLVRNQDVSLGMDMLDRLAYALNMETWQLLIPNIDIAMMDAEHCSALVELGQRLAPLQPDALERAVALCHLAIDVALKDRPPTPAASTEQSRPRGPGAARLDPRGATPKRAPQRD